jgi:hypothetical protein
MEKKASWKSKLRIVDQSCSTHDDSSEEGAMFALDQSLAGSYHVADLRAQARRDARARRVAPSPLRALARRISR